MIENSSQNNPDRHTNEDLNMVPLSKSAAIPNIGLKTDLRTDLRADLKADLRTGSRTIPADSQIAVSKTMRMTGKLISAVFRL